MTALRSDTGDDVPARGPKMQALSDRRRGFVCGLFDAPQKKGRLLFAARAAGYGTATSTNKSLGVIASRLVSDERVQAAIAEESHRRLRALSPAALGALENLLLRPAHKDHGRAIGLILDRSDPVETTHHVKVEDMRPPSIAATEAVLKRIAELAARVGLSQLAPPSPPPIDAEFTEVAPAIEQVSS